MKARGPVLGVVADDFTGATDVASMLVNAGLRTVQVIGVPQGAASAELLASADAIVVALKSRTIAAADAVAQSLAAWRWLQAAGARQCYFKVCSTFDSTPAGNIGPVAQALLRETGSDFTVVCPAFPVNGRTVFRGHLFVGDQLLSDSGMRDHPLTPMTDSNLVRVLQAQCTQRVGLLRGADLPAGIAKLRAEGVQLAIADATVDDDLRTLAAAAIDLPVLVAGSGLALGLPALYAQRGWVQLDTQASRLDAAAGAAVVLSGSCSQATNAQVARWMEAGRAARAIDALALSRGEPVVAQALAWAREHLATEPVLLHATLPPAQLKAVQSELGAERAGALVEAAMAELAQGLAEAGVQQFVVAGGETSGAVVQALGVAQLRIGPAICPGVPWTQAAGRALWLALKSGNFGGPDFFAQALATLGKAQ